jgi:hypothetical protein
LADAVFDLAFSLAAFTRFESSRFAFSNSALRLLLNPFPARLMKYVSIRMPDPGPRGETFFDASCRAIVAASFVNSPSGGYVETVFTLLTHFFFEAPLEARLDARGDGPSLFFATSPS